VSRRLATLIAGAAVVLVVGAPPSPGAAAGAPSPKLRGDLAALVLGTATLDARIPPLVRGYLPGEIPFFAVLTEPNDARHRAALEALGARVLATYRSVDAFALAARPGAVRAVSELAWVSWLAPVELVTTLDHEHEVDQTRGTPIDVGATGFWDRGITGTGVKIAVLDTGLTPHDDLDDLDFRHWSGGGPAKVLHERNFVGGGCLPGGVIDGHGHGTHVAGIATGTGEGTPDAADDGKYLGIAPGAQLLVGKVMTDAGAGINSDLVVAMEAMALPEDPGNCQFGADIVNMSLGSESRPLRLNTDSDVDFVALVLNRLAVEHGTLFVAAAGNSGPFIGSLLEAPGAAAQALSVSATAKDWDVNHDDTASGDTCAGWLHPPSGSPGDNDCTGGIGTQPPSLSNFTSRGPSGDVFLRPDVAAPGYNIVSVQASTGTAIGANDVNLNTRNDPLYATATGTSMAAPAAAGSAALVLDAYRQEHGGDPSGASGVKRLRAPAYALLRAALMNTAGPDLYDARWILTTEIGSLTLYEVRNRDEDAFVGPLSEGAGKLDIGRASEALSEGVVIYSAATAAEAEPGTGQRDFQGSWQIGPIKAGQTRTQKFVLRAAPGIGTQHVSFSFEPGHPSDASGPIPLPPLPRAWQIELPGTTTVNQSKVVKLRVKVPRGAPAGFYSGTVVAQVAGGQTLRVPVFAAVSLHDKDPAAGNPPGAQARISSAEDVFGKDNTIWPAVPGAPGTGANADWLVYPLDLAAGLAELRASVYDAAAGDETYDVYLYDGQFDLVASTHPFSAPGVTDRDANDARGPSTPEDPELLTVANPLPGRYYLVVNRAKIGGTTAGDFGAFVVTVDEIG
jgi:subtilisin family serine protease